MTGQVLRLGRVNTEEKGQEPAQHLPGPQPQAVTEDASTVPSWREKVMVTSNQLKNGIEF